MSIIKYREIKAKLKCVELKKRDSYYDEHYDKFQNQS